MTTDSDSDTNQKGDLVVVGSSAGGVAALSTLVSTLNKNFPAPIVLAQHLDPQRPSHLGTILERRSTLPIVIVGENPPTPLENGKIYVVPANKHVTVSDGFVLLENDHADRPKPSIDRLLSSAAEVYGEHLLAVILTGSGSDGAAGAVEVKNAGGVVIVQNPQTAAYPSMPLALPPTAVDHVVKVDEVALLLYDIIKGVNLPATDKVEDPLRDVLAQVSSGTNIDFRNYKGATILRRVARRMAVTHNGTIREYAEYLHNHPGEVQELVKAFLIKVTGFFRDPEAYETLRENVISRLVERAKENGRTLRFWSAGCATGEEAYSLALLIADYLGSDFPEWNIKIFATDVAADAINFARRGAYPENVLNDLPLEYKERYFERFENGYRVSRALRQTVIFGEQDISRGTPFPRIDLVSCRNLLIYLKPELQRVVLDLFAYSLQHTRGFLFLGKAETTRPTKANFELIDKKWKIYRCMSRPIAFPIKENALSVRIPASNFREPRKRTLSGAPVSNSSEMMEVEIEVSHLRRISETVLRYVNLAVVIIDRAYRIVTINASARRMLGIRDIAYDQDFLHTVRGMPYHEIRKAIDNAFNERSAMNLAEIELDHAVEGSGCYVNITIMVMPDEQSAPELAVISVVDVTELVQMRKRLEGVQREHVDMVNELSEANRRYSTMNKELQHANEELQAANEELMLMQEELQATNEEFEATNEELQATNEELETNNEEMQATNEELQTTNDELSARTLELQDFGKQYRVEQFQLSSLLERFPHYVMVLNATDLTIQSINPGYGQLFSGRNVIGLSIDEAFSGKQLESLIELLKKVTRDGQALTSEPMKANADGTGDGTFVHTVVPISDVMTGNVDRLFVYSEKMEEAR